MKSFLVSLFFLFSLSACNGDSRSTKVVEQFIPECINTEGDSFISGTIDFYDTLDFTGSEILTVDLEDTTLQDADAIKKSSLCLELTKNTSQPIEFKLFYNSSQIENNNSYSLQFRFYDLSQDTSYSLRYVNEESVPVLTQGFGSYVTVTLTEIKG